MKKSSVIYKITYTSSAVKDIKALDRVVQKRLKKKIDLLIRDPHVRAKKMIDSEIGEYRWRVGNYRIVIDIEKSMITVLRVRHRRDVYR